jgi:hypothetical protein
MMELEFRPGAAFKAHLVLITHVEQKQARVGEAHVGGSLPLVVTLSPSYLGINSAKGL